jgi:hypothetical protein
MIYEAPLDINDTNSGIENFASQARAPRPPPTSETPSTWGTLTRITIRQMLFELQAKFHIVEKAGTPKFSKKSGSEV